MNNTNELMSREQVAELFGISKQSVIAWEKAGRLHPIKLSYGTVRHLRADVQALITAASAGSNHAAQA